MKVKSDNGTIEIDKKSGAILRVFLERPLVEFVKTSFCSGGLFEVALPLENYIPHRIRINKSQTVEIYYPQKNVVLITYVQLKSSKGTFSLKVEIKIQGGQSGEFSLWMRLVNQTEIVIPQTIFPNLTGLIPINSAGQTLLRFGRDRLKPYLDLKVLDGAVQFFDLYRRRYFDYQLGSFCMK